MDSFIRKDGKQLRLGYTTGSCAAAASKAAGWMLLTGAPLKTISLQTPKGITLELPIFDIQRGSLESLWYCHQNLNCSLK